MFRNVRFSGFFISVAAVITATVLICIFAVSCSGEKITFETSYYFVCYRTADNSISASSLSDTASSYGGAGYILYYDGNYYVTVACYYNDNDAQRVYKTLKNRNLDCSVLEVTTKTYTLKSNSAKNNAELFLGNLNTLNSLSSLAYDCANGLDTGEFNQSKAKNVVSAIKSGLNGLLKANSNNCFTEDLKFLIAECEDKEDGYLFSKDMRYLQIALTDVIINAELY